ncbi:MAG TPA: hemolysin family protein [Candidatus Dormibacteraeota bacterium]|nr:hemolysin family protein [Candidatus Dormibacteraeota bacterium]
MIMMITWLWTLGVVALIVIVSIFAYLDRVYRELERAVGGKLRERLDAFEATVEPRLGFERTTAASLASLVTHLWLAALLAVTLVAVVQREPVVWRAVLELIVIIGTEIVVALHFVPSFLLARSGTRWLLPLVPAIRASFIVASPLETVVSLGNLLAELKEEHEPGGQQDQDQAIEALVEAARGEGLLERDDVRLIEQVVEFGDKRAKDMMTPRPDIVAVSAVATVEQLRRLMVQTKFSRVPIYENSLDEIVGLVSSHDVMEVSERDASRRIVRELMRPVLMVPESKFGSELLREMQLKHQQMAIVIDEYGLVAGVVSVEDLVEEIIGEIGEEDRKPVPDVVREAPGSLLLRGSVPIEKLEELLSVEIDHERSGDSTTIAGLLNHLAGHVPKPGEVVDTDGLRFEILEANQRKVLRLRARRLLAASSSTAQGRS